MKQAAVVILIVFVVTIVVYPLIFGTDPQPANQPPVELEIEK